jgi:hypothetical protein
MSLNCGDTPDGDRTRYLLALKAGALRWNQEQSGAIGMSTNGWSQPPTRSTLVSDLRFVESCYSDHPSLLLQPSVTIELRAQASWIICRLKLIRQSTHRVSDCTGDATSAGDTSDLFATRQPLAARRYESLNVAAYSRRTPLHAVDSVASLAPMFLTLGKRRAWWERPTTTSSCEHAWLTPHEPIGCTICFVLRP